MQDEKDDVQDKYGRFCERVGNPDSFDTDQGPQSQRVDRDHSEYFQEVAQMGVGQHFPDLIDAGKDIIPHVEGQADAGADQEIVCVIEDHIPVCADISQEKIGQVRIEEGQQDPGFCKKNRCIGFG